MSDMDDNTKWHLPHDDNRVEIHLEDCLFVYFFDRLIGIVSDSGLLRWRDKNYPVFLIEYLLDIPTLDEIRRN